MGSCHPTPAQRPANEAIPLAVVTTPKSKPPQSVTGESNSSKQGTALRDPTPPTGPRSQRPRAPERLYPRPGPSQHKPSAKHRHPNLTTTTGLLANARTPLYYDIRETHKENIRCNSSTSLVVSPKLRPQLKLTDDEQPNDEQPSCGEIPLYAETNAHSLARTQQHPTPA